MARNLFFLRGWTVTLVAAVFSLAVARNENLYMLIAYYLIFTFWVSDGYFLSQERLFRALYDQVRLLPNEKINFSMNTTEFYKIPKNTWIHSIFSKTLIAFYTPLLVITIIILFLK